MVSHKQPLPGSQPSHHQWGGHLDMSSEDLSAQVAGVFLEWLPATDTLDKTMQSSPHSPPHSHHLPLGCPREGEGQDGNLAPHLTVS